MYRLYYLIVLSLWLHADMSPQHVLTKNCLNSYKSSYLSQADHKAFVYAREPKTDKNRCNWGYGYVSRQEAIDSAMKGCQSVMLNAECILVDTDGKFDVKDGTFSRLTPVDETPLSKAQIETFMKEAKDVILGNCYPYFEKYLNANEHKSFGYSVDANGNYACGYSYQNQSENISKKQAIKSCKDNKLKRGNKTPKSACKVYATNKKVLLTAKDYDLKPLPKPLKMSPVVYDKKLKKAEEIITNLPCRIQFKYYLKSKAHHAYYVVQGKDTEQMCGRSEGAFSRETAKQKAKESCEKHALEKQIKGECKLLSVDFEFVGTKEMFQMPKEEKVIQKTAPKTQKPQPTLDLHTPTTLKNAMDIAVKAMSKNLPMKIDDELQLTKVNAKGNQMILGYTLTNLSSKDISASTLKSLLYEDIKNQVCTDKETVMMLKKGMVTEYTYEGKDMKYIGDFSFDAKTCGLKTHANQLLENVKKLIDKK
ncbi:MAG: hypothetical protein L3J43_10925 [Sulfurovum sp.]|nr:hypothetical protein [Sulfurovum sp.]